VASKHEFWQQDILLPIEVMTASHGLSRAHAAPQLACKGIGDCDRLIEILCDWNYILINSGGGLILELMFTVR
jgi:hypothetical protein